MGCYLLDLADHMTVIASREFFVEVAKGNIAGHSLVNKFGRNSSVAAATEEDVIEFAANINWLQAATTVRIKAGGNAADTAAGAGAREVTVYGLDSSGNLAEEAIATAGASASSATTTSFWRVFRAVVTASGTYTAANTGVVTIENSAGGTDLIQIAATEGQSQFGAYSIDTGKTGYLLSLRAQVDTGNNEATIRIYTRDDLNDVSAPMKAKRLRQDYPGISGQFDVSFRSSPITLPGFSDIWIAAQAGAGTAAVVSAQFEILLVDN